MASAPEEPNAMSSPKEGVRGVHGESSASLTSSLLLSIVDSITSPVAAMSRRLTRTPDSKDTPKEETAPLGSSFSPSDKEKVALTQYRLWPPHETVALKGGWIVKRGGVVKTWKQRYMVLMTNGQLFYYKGNQPTKTNKPLGELDLRYSFELKDGFSESKADVIDWPEGSKLSQRLQLISASRTLSVVVSASECKEWLEILTFVQRFTLPYEDEKSTTYVHPEQRKANQLLRMLSLTKLASNMNCFDCGLSPTTWVSCKLRIFLCLRCAIIHRSREDMCVPANLVAEIAEGEEPVRSILLGSFSDEQIKDFEMNGGNLALSHVLEPLLSLRYQRPAHDNDGITQFWIQKYKLLQFMAVNTAEASERSMQDDTVPIELEKFLLEDVDNSFHDQPSSQPNDQLDDCLGVETAAGAAGAAKIEAAESVIQPNAQEAI